MRKCSGPLASRLCSGKGTDVSRAFRVKGLNALTRRGRRMHLSYATEKSYAGRAQSYSRALPKYPKEWTSKKNGRGFSDGAGEAECGGGDAESGAECHCPSLQGRPRDAAGDGGCAASEASGDGARGAEHRGHAGIVRGDGGCGRLPDAPDCPPALRVRAAGERAAGIAHQGCGSGWRAAHNPGKQGSGVKN